MAFSAGRRVASPFAQRAERFAKATETPDISTVSDTSEPESETPASDAPEVIENEVKTSVDATNQESANDASDGTQEPTPDELTNAEPTRGRGRPRPSEVKARDERVLNHVIANPGLTRAQLEEALTLTANEVYMSLFRLRKLDRIERRHEAGGHKWYPSEDKSNA